jgi:magnesium and cobalt exporter, CNNM family
MTPILVFLAVVALLALSAVLALIETSFTRLGAVGARALEGTHPDRAERLEPLLVQGERVLAPVLLLALSSHIVLATLLALVAADRWGAVGVAVAVAVEIVIVFVVAEAAPKAFALAESLRVAAALAPVAERIAGLPLFAPLARALVRLGRGRGQRPSPVVSEEDLIALAEAAADAAVIDAEESDLIESVFEFGDTIAREVMVPRSLMVTLAADDTVRDALHAVVEHGYTRFPVVGDGVDDIVGVVLSKDLVRSDLAGGGDRPLRRLLRPAHFVPETKRVAQLMPEMQQQQFHLAVVVDEYGGTAGLVTLEDLIEELVGEIVDEFDDESPLVEELEGGTIRLSARMPVDDFSDLVEVDLPEGDWDTVGGLFYNLLGHVPEPGDAVELGGLRLAAEEVDGRRIDTLLLSVADA